MKTLFTLARVRSDGCRLEALALLLLYVAGIVVVPAVHKATVCHSAAICPTQFQALTDDARTTPAVVPAAGETPDHDPLTCPICQLAATPQVVWDAPPSLSVRHVAASGVPVTACAYQERLRFDPHRPRGPPCPFRDDLVAYPTHQTGGYA